MPNVKPLRDNEIEYVTTNDIFGDIGFSPSAAIELTIKSDLHMALMDHIRASRRTQAELAEILHVHQPDVSNLLRGKLHLFSITKLFQYADRLKLKVRIQVEDQQVNANCAPSGGLRVQRRAALKSDTTPRATEMASMAQSTKPTRRRIVA